jgi:hypothetical protein
MEHAVSAVENRFEVGVQQIGLGHAEPRVLKRPREVRPYEEIGLRTAAVDAGNRHSGAEQGVNQLGADETGRSGHYRSAAV